MALLVLLAMGAGASTEVTWQRTCQTRSACAVRLVSTTNFTDSGPARVTRTSSNQTSSHQIFCVAPWSAA